MKLQRFAALGAAALAAIGLSFAAATPALAHDSLIDVQLEIDSTTVELIAFTLIFNNSIMNVGTEIIVQSEAGESVAPAKPEVSGPTVRQWLDAPLAPGEYQAAWRVVSSDGHPIEGSFGLNIAADGMATITSSSQAAGGEAAPGGGDESAAPGLTSAPRSSGMPAAGWIAIGLVLAKGTAVAVILIARKGKRNGDGGVALNVSNETETGNATHTPPSDS